MLVERKDVTLMPNTNEIYYVLVNIFTKQTPNDIQSTQLLFNSLNLHNATTKLLLKKSLLKPPNIYSS